jgi:hypothetical protein
VTVLNTSDIYLLTVDDGGKVLFKTSGDTVTQNVTNLTITDGGLVTVYSRFLSPETSTGKARVLFVTNLFFGESGPTGKLDLVNNDVVVHGGLVGSWDGSAYTDLSGLVASGFHGTTAWTGNGINSSAAAATPSVHAIGIARAHEVTSIEPTETAVFDNQTVLGTDVLIKYTYGGDANLDGKVNVDDYGRVDSSIGIGVKGWYNGDLNYDGKVNVDDYGVIDSIIGIQGSPL